MGGGQCSLLPIEATSGASKPGGGRHLFRKLLFHPLTGAIFLIAMQIALVSSHILLIYTVHLISVASCQFLYVFSFACQKGHFNPLAKARGVLTPFVTSQTSLHNSATQLTFAKLPMGRNTFLAPTSPKIIVYKICKKILQYLGNYIEPNFFLVSIAFPTEIHIFVPVVHTLSQFARPTVIVTYFPRNLRRKLQTDKISS